MTIPKGYSPQKPFACYLADASSATSKYFVTGNLIYLSMVNVVMPVLAGFVLPIVLAKLAHTGAVPSFSVPAEVIPVATDAPSPLAVGTKIMIGILANAAMEEPISVGSNTGLTSGVQLMVKILDANTNIVPITPSAISGYGGAIGFFGLFANQLTLSVANRISSVGLSAIDIGSGTTASGLSDKQIINIALALISFGALTWDHVQHSICDYQSQ